MQIFHLSCYLEKKVLTYKQCKPHFGDCKSILFVMLHVLYMNFVLVIQMEKEHIKKCFGITCIIIILHLPFSRFTWSDKIINPFDTHAHTRFSWTILSKGKGAMRLSLCEAPIQGQQHFLFSCLKTLSVEPATSHLVVRHSTNSANRLVK